MDEFFDAKSLLGSLQEAFSSALAASNAGASAFYGGAAGADGGGLGGAFAMHDLAASIREVGGSPLAGAFTGEGRGCATCHCCM